MGEKESKPGSEVGGHHQGLLERDGNVVREGTRLGCLEVTCREH